MELFSERFGYSTARKILEYECISEELRMAIYNVIFEWLNDYYSDNASLRVCRSLWSELWHLPLDDFPEPDPLASLAINGLAYSPSFFKEMKRHLFEEEWFKAYDLVEFVAKQYLMLDKESESAERTPIGQMLDNNDESLLEDFSDDMNDALAREMSGYRLVGACIAPITNDAEIRTLEQSLSASDRFSGVRMHTEKSLEHYSKKPEPDLTNAIKESISSVEAAARIVVGSEKDTLGEALKKLGKAGAVHPSLVAGWKNIYGFTSDVGGIRHASNTEEVAVDANLAKYMLISCSAFANYLMELELLKGGV